jgi:RimJ/RimL family protein N-acetyltransferase
MKVRGHESREMFHAWFESVDLGFAHFLDGALVGHTSFLNDRPEDRVVEIGNTWLNPRAWGTGANTEAKYLLMQHAFEDEGYLRVEFKTDATNDRAWQRWRRCRRRSRASSASTCWCAAASGATRPGTR